ncbi:MAG: phosphoadenosine phosphosulfate reductase family protein [Candidatus Omnitrophica bacterium]|nr:phosphoadenosine phosphosulfate reductase family protein [Candidatus Omnitrophota bacterium]
MKTQHIINVSGGKDSTACYLLALKKGIDFRAVFADTGNEHEYTYEFLEYLPKVTGGPVVEIVRADFSKQIRKKRETVRDKWKKDGVPKAQIKRALELLQPTGNPFLDMCLWKGRFPSTKARFCTEELKVFPLTFQVFFPALKNGRVLSWQGVRAEESRSRSELPFWNKDDTGVYIWRPLLRWSAEQVFDLHRQMGVEPNKLYKLGFSRVGCMPCIMARKLDIRNMAMRFPEHVKRLREWEELVSKTSKRGQSTFFPSKKISSKNNEPAHIDEIAYWSKTDRGGSQFNLWSSTEELPACASIYGLCE